MGGIAKCLASFCLHPLNTVRSRLQQKPNLDDESETRSKRLGLKDGINKSETGTVKK